MSHSSRPPPPPYTSPRKGRSRANSSAHAQTQTYTLRPDAPVFTPALPKSRSSPLLARPVYPSRHCPGPPMSDDDDDDAIYTARTAAAVSRRSRSSTNIRSRFAFTSATSSGSSTAIGSAATAPTTASTNGNGWGNGWWDADAPSSPEPPGITTRSGAPCAGETETETEAEGIFPRRLPTARITPPAAPLIPPRATPLLFEAARWLSVVPAVFGVLYNAYRCVWPPEDERLWRADFGVAALWAVLTGYQCLRMTTGLLTRWRAYYTPLSTLIRLLAFQAICWPATRFVLTLFGHERRPVVCWAIVGSTTCWSRAVQMWVTSNLVVPHYQQSGSGRDVYAPLLPIPTPPPGVGSGGVGIARRARRSSTNTMASVDMPPPYSASSPDLGAPLELAGERSGEREREAEAEGGMRVDWEWVNALLDALVGADEEVRPRRGGRRWDWRAVGVRCVLPAGLCYCVMAWVGEVRREWAVGGC